MNRIQITNQRLIAVLLILLITFVTMIVIGPIVVFITMGSGMSQMMDTNGQTISDMISICTQMIHGFQGR